MRRDDCISRCAILAGHLGAYHISSTRRVIFSTPPQLRDASRTPHRIVLDTAIDCHPQIGANLLLFVSVNLLGTMSFFFCERQQRRAFLETCQSLEAKLVLEEESQEQASDHLVFYPNAHLFVSQRASPCRTTTTVRLIMQLIVSCALIAL